MVGAMKNDCAHVLVYAPVCVIVRGVDIKLIECSRSAPLPRMVVNFYVHTRIFHFVDWFAMIGPTLGYLMYTIVML